MSRTEAVQESLFASCGDGADISPCGAYRYTLWRRWGDGRVLTVIGLNPSTADATQDDPTIRRCIGFARREGCAGLVRSSTRLEWTRCSKCGKSAVGVPVREAA